MDAAYAGSPTISLLTAFLVGYLIGKLDANVISGYDGDCLAIEKVQCSISFRKKIPCEDYPSRLYFLNLPFL